ncbi:MAG: histidine--tRNA ligase [candidate division Zixibacteria bacterium]|nr:histidine--tRNA ligase [candidate division Zixibacteria bacterium]
MAKIGLPAGTRDFLPEQLIFRQKVISIMKEVFERYGFLPLETPAVERLDVLSGKYGEEADRLIFKVLKRGEELKSALAKGGELADMGLRYDLTVPLCRVIAMHQNEIGFPFRRYQIQPVWRADKPQKGRYREFYQCDVDVVGQEAPLADAELVAMTYEVLTALGFSDFTIRVNHRQILSALAEWAGIPKEKQPGFFAALDKLDKVGLESVKREFETRRLAVESIEKILPVIEANSLDFLKQALGHTEKGKGAVDETECLMKYATKLGVPAQAAAYDLSLARGLDYYTGPIFETILSDAKIGSVTGGGRYDNLVGLFTGKEVPATGTSFGLERIMDVLAEKGKLEETANVTQVVVLPFDEASLTYGLEVAAFLRKERVRTEMYPFAEDKMRDKFGWVSKRKVAFAAAVGPDEMKERQVTFKNMATGQQVKLPFGQLPVELKRG